MNPFQRPGAGSLTREPGGRRVDSQLRAIFENALDAIVTFGEAGLIESANPAALRLFGYQGGELLGQSVEVLLPALDDRDAAGTTSVVGTLRDGVAGLRRKARGRRRDGRLFSVDISVVSIEANGTPARFCAFLRDITEAERSEASQRARYKVLEAIASGAPLRQVLQLLVDAIEHLTEAQAVLVQLLEAPAGQLGGGVDRLTSVGTPLGERLRLITGEIRALGTGRERLTIDRIDAGTGSGADAEAGAAASGIRTRWSLPIVSSDEHILGTLSVFRAHRGAPDAVTHQVLVSMANFAAVAIERCERADALRRREERLRILTDAAPVMISYVDKDRRYRFNNARYAEWFARPLDWFEGRHVSEVLGPEVYERTGPMFERVLDGHHVTFDGTVPHHSGEPRRCMVSLVPDVGPDGKARGFVAAITDITDVHHMEEQLRQSQKMEAVGRLASGIAHDFNNLLMGILGCCRVARGGLGHAATAGPYLEEIEAAAERGARLTRQLLAFSRKRPIELADVDLNELLVEAEGMLAQLLGEDVTLSVRPAPTPAAINADRGQLEQIIMNLAVNARDAMPHGGGLSLTAEVLGLEDEAVRGQGLSPGPAVRLTVTDTGCGMPPAVSARVFEPFFTTKGTEGTGLGLSTVYAIVTRFGGRIEVDSEPGLGTTFRILFPAAPRAHDPAASASDAGEGPEHGGPATVLVVEDEDLVRMTVRHFLEEAGYRVIEADEPATGLELARTHEGRIDLLLTDMVMPGMSGRELARELEAERPSLKTVYMSAYPDEILVEQGRLEAGMPTLEKPFTQDGLVEKVRSVLAGG